jgi:predicted transcriptional regulator
MNTTTIRVDQDTHRRFVAISRASNRPLVEVLRDAAESLERARFAAEVSAQLDALRQRPDEWANYTMDADLSLRDGLS